MRELKFIDPRGRVAWVYEQTSGIRVVRTASNPGVRQELAGPIPAAELGKTGTDIPKVSKATASTLNKVFTKKWRPIDLGN